MKAITILSGPVGAGKTTVARAFVAAAPGPVAYIEGDTFWSFIAKGARTRHKNFRTIMTAMTAAAVPYALADYEVLLDFSIPPWFLGNVRAVAQTKDVPINYSRLAAERGSVRSPRCRPRRRRDCGLCALP